MTQKLISQIRDRILTKYQPGSDFPVLEEQFWNFKNLKPLLGLRVLHSTPLFENALAKLLPILSSGATLTIVPPPYLPFDKNIFQFLKSLGVDIRERISSEDVFDIVYDCMGSHSKIYSKIGAIELTRTGSHYYANGNRPCIQVDESRIKLFEDLLGTSDGLMRVFENLNYSLQRKKILIFGLGKVGTGIFLRLKRAEVEVKVVERSDYQNGSQLTNFIDFDNKQAVYEAVLGSDAVITATGVNGALKDIDARYLLSGNKLLINIGAEDEYGPNIDSSRIVNNRMPANFMLKEPTRLKYLDATFALHNQSAVDLLSHRFQPGINEPLESTQRSIVEKLKNSKSIWEEICALNLASYFS